MSAIWRPAAHLLVRDLRAVFGDRLRSVVAYGPHIDGITEGPLSCLALVETLTWPDLEACAGHARAWEREGLTAPLLLPEAEFLRSFDAFPLEYDDIIRAHERLHGTDLLAGASVPLDDIRRACEVQAKSHLVHLREGYLTTGGRPGAIADLVRASAPAFAALLRKVARLSGAGSQDRAEAEREGARIAGLSEGVVRAVLALQFPTTMATTDTARLFPDYLAAVTHLAEVVDTWRRL